MRGAFLGIALTAVSGLTVQAEEWLASGGAYGGATQARAVCYFSNVGTTNLLLKAPQINDNNGNAQPLVIDQCRNIFNRIVPPKRHCGIAADIATNLTYSCQTKVESTVNARGTLEFRDASQNILSTIELR